MLTAVSSCYLLIFPLVSMTCISTSIKRPGLFARPQIGVMSSGTRQDWREYEALKFMIYYIPKCASEVALLHHFTSHQDHLLSIHGGEYYIPFQVQYHESSFRIDRCKLTPEADPIFITSASIVYPVPIII